MEESVRLSVRHVGGVSSRRSCQGDVWLLSGLAGAQQEELWQHGRSSRSRSRRRCRSRRICRSRSRNSVKKISYKLELLKNFSVPREIPHTKDL